MCREDCKAIKVVQGDYSSWSRLRKNNDKLKNKEKKGMVHRAWTRHDIQLNMKIILLEGVTSLNVHAQESENRYPCLSAADPETSLHAGEKYSRLYEG